VTQVAVRQFDDQFVWHLNPRGQANGGTVERSTRSYRLGASV
jgi:hypothetical protein